MKKQRSTAPKRTETARSAEDIKEKIRWRAYELYELRGKQDGHDLDDWLTAEVEITAKYGR
jgi:hypothetical protein